MTTLAEWQSFARSTNLKGWSRLKKNDLGKFLVENLWGGGLDQPKMNKAARLRIQSQKSGNPLMKKNKKINVPFLIPERRLFPSRDFPRVVPRAIKENINNVVDWANWLESVRDGEIRKRSTPAVEKLKKTNRRIVGRKTDRGKRQIRFWKIRETIHHSRR